MDELKQILSSLEGIVEELQVKKKESVADLVALACEWDLWKQPLMSKTTELEELRVTVNAESDCVELIKIRLVRQETSFEMTKAALELHLAEAEARPYATLTEMTAHRDHLCDDVDHIFFYQSADSFEFKETCRQLSVVRAEIETVTGHLTGQKRLKKETKQKVTNAQYEPDGVKDRITHFGGRESRTKVQADPILRRMKRLSAGIERV